jgi:signal transduction histidine kinase
MVALDLAFLFIYIFSAYAYGATVVLALRQLPVWYRGHKTAGTPAPVMDPVTLTLCAVSTAWFVMLAVGQFQALIGTRQFGVVVDVIGFVLSFAFPPLIMHTVLNEDRADCTGAERSPLWQRLLVSVYAVSIAICAYAFAVVFDVAPKPRFFGAWLGISLGLLFVICSVYCIVLMTGRTRRRPAEAASTSGLRRTMIGLFLTMIPLFLILTVVESQQQRVAGELVQRLARMMPIFFLIASVYFENRIEFYDLIVKRAALLAINVIALGGYFAVTLGALDRLPTGMARPWLFAVALLPLAMVLPWVNVRISRWLDRMWFGREFTPVEAVKQVLSAMQPATDEQMLTAATEARLTAMFHTPIRLLLDDAPAPPESVVEAIAPLSDDSRPVRVAVTRQPGTRPLLSEDLALLRSLASVFSYMLENVRLQRRRQEQDQLAHELRLQTSRSELKALRAQINPHFLFNALNAIASLIHTDPTRADAAVEQLAEVFRYTLRRSEQEWAPLDQELAFARAYLDVEQARFGRRLSFTIDALPSAARAQVPSMLLHTLVENAVKHGVSQVRGEGRIDIRAHAADDRLVLEVRDNGPGPDSSSKRPGGEGFGLHSIHDRLRGHFGQRAALVLHRDSSSGVTIARVEMPLLKAQDERDSSVFSRR